MNDLMSLIDDVKESIPEGKYLELCNAMKAIHQEKEKTPALSELEKANIARNTLRARDSFQKLFHYKKDRTIKFNYGMKKNMYFPHSIVIANTSCYYKGYDARDNTVTFHSELPGDVEMLIHFNVSIRTNTTLMCTFEAVVNNVPVWTYENDDLTIKIVKSSKYDNTDESDTESDSD
jgi:hypothetical protein